MPRDDLRYVVRTPADVLGPLNDVEARNAPARLYLAGDLALLDARSRVSIVGSRNASAAGLGRASTYARILTEGGAVVVSGLAEGIDTSAHTGAIAAGGRTIAVLGTGLRRVYPSSNRELQSRVAREHLVITQFPPDTPPSRRNFPMRNRTMALLTNATIIVEAGASSGTLHQGWEALRLGRLLFLDETVAADPDLEWPDAMIRYGAQVLSLENIGRVVEELPGFADAARLAFF
jgi:DNA processing protein